MKIAYFDCFSGISGDMILGSLIDLGLKVEQLKEDLAKLNLSDYEIKVKKVEKGEIWGTKFNVNIYGQTKERHLDDILHILENSHLEKIIKERSKRIFRKLAEAESRIHNKGINEIHFHEVGATDAIIDIVGAMIGIRKLKIEKVYSSSLQLGTGFIKCAHGTFPVPAPATLELLRNIPTYSTGMKKELVTPTGAAILTTICQNFGDMPSVKLRKIGYGAGTRDLSIPNMLRVLIGDVELTYEEDRVLMLETNIDNMNPEFYEYIMDRLLQKGAKDVFLTPVHMKKNRPGILLSVISPLDRDNELLETIFNETTTLGVRITKVRRKKIKREIKTINTPWGELRVKLEIMDGKVKGAIPEYEDCKKVARDYNLSLKEVYEEAKKKASIFKSS